MGEDKGALWSKGITSTRSSDEYGGMDNEVGSGNPSRIQRVQLQGNKNRRELGIGVSREGAVV